jgi:hypothetical protein
MNPSAQRNTPGAFGSLGGVAPQHDKAYLGAGDRIPPGYADAVADYFRRLSGGK